QYLFNLHSWEEWQEYVKEHCVSQHSTTERERQRPISTNQTLNSRQIGRWRSRSVVEGVLRCLAVLSSRFCLCSFASLRENFWPCTLSNCAPLPKRATGTSTSA